MNKGKKKTIRDIINMLIKNKDELRESQDLEFKSSLRWDVKLNRVNKELRFEVLKTIVAFLNAEGGILVIGVDDKGEIIGLNNDLETLKNSLDGFEQHLTNLISGHIGPEYWNYIKLNFEKLKKKDLCFVEVIGSMKPAFLKEGDRKDYYARINNSSRKLDGKEQFDYQQEKARRSQVPSIEDLRTRKKTLNWHKYLKSINSEYQELNNIYVPLRLSSEKSKQDFHLNASAELERMLKENNKILILAEPGAGKTAILQIFSYECAKKSLDKKKNKIPVFVPLKLFDLNNGGLNGLINGCFKKHGLDLSDKLLKDILIVEKEFIFLFDGINEIPEKQKSKAIQQLERFVLENDQFNYIFTSRPDGSITKIDDSKVISINEFSKEDIYEFFKKFYFYRRGHSVKLEEIRSKVRSNLFSFLSNPLIANIFSMILVEIEDFGEYSKSSIFREFVRSTLEREREKEELDNVPSESEIVIFLSYFGYDMIEKSRYAISENQFDAKVHNIWIKLKKENRITSAESQIRNWLSKGIFVIKDRENRYFWHAQLQEFFAAKKLSELYSEKEKSAMNKLLDLRWNEVSVFTFDYLENAEDLLSYAADGENYHLLGKCLRGEAGTEAQKISRDIVENFLDSEDDKRRLSGVKILGVVRNTYFVLERLLEVLSQEERMLEERYRGMGYSLWSDIYGSDISINEIIFGPLVDKSIKNEDRLTFKRDFRIFNEIEQILENLFWTESTESIKLVPKVDNFSITARGFLTGIIGRMKDRNKESEILDFLESRLDEALEPSIEVRSAAFGQIQELFKEEPENKRLSIIWQNREKLAANEDFIGGFPSCFFKAEEETSDRLYFIPVWLDDSYKNIKDSKIEDSAVEVYLELMKYILAKLDKKKEVIDEDKLKKRMKKELLIEETKEDEGIGSLMFGPNRYLKIVLTIVNSIVLNDSVESMEELIKLSYEKNLLTAFFTIVGFEMARYIFAAQDARKKFEKIMEDRSDSVINRFLEDKKIKFLIILSQMADFSFRNDSADVGFNDVINNILDRVKNMSQLEDLMFEAIHKRIIEEGVVFKWLEHIGNEKTAENLREDIKRLKIEDSEDVKSLIKKLLNKN